MLRDNKRKKLTHKGRAQIKRSEKERLLRENCKLNATHQEIRVLASEIIDEVIKQNKVHAQQQQKRPDNAPILFYLSIYLLDYMSLVLPVITDRGDLYKCTDSTLNKKSLFFALKMFVGLMIAQEVCSFILIDTGIMQRCRVPALSRHLTLMVNSILLFVFGVLITDLYGTYKTVSDFSIPYCEVALGDNVRCNAADENLKKYFFTHPVLMKDKPELIQWVRNLLQKARVCQKSVDLCYNDYLVKIKKNIHEQSFLNIMINFFKACIGPVLISRVQLADYIASLVVVLYLPLYFFIYSSYLFRDYARARIQNQFHYRLLYLLDNLR